LSAWIPHVLLYAVGPALACALLLIFGFSADAAWARLRAPTVAPLRQRLCGLQALELGYLGLTLGYLVLVAWTRNRVVRAAIPPLVSATVLALLLTSRFREQLKPRLAACRIPLIALAWLVLGYQLLLPLHAGERYAHHPTALEYYNHPLHLRALVDKDDMHT